MSTALMSSDNFSPQILSWRIVGLFFYQASVIAMKHFTVSRKCKHNDKAFACSIDSEIVAPFSLCCINERSI